MKYFKGYRIVLKKMNGILGIWGYKTQGTLDFWYTCQKHYIFKRILFKIFLVIWDAGDLASSVSMILG